MASSSSSLILNNSRSPLIASSSSSSSPRAWRYRVFTSFHGPDVRKTFLSHLRKQFDYNGITMFDDQGIERGQTIAPSLTQAIRDSRISIVVLSKNYASSSWCLDELLEILECKQVIGQLVMTVFYGVDPSDVRKQTGEFGRAFNETCDRKTEQDRKRWSLALEAVGNIAGEHFLNWDNEAAMIEKIAKDVSHKLNATPSRDFDGMVGLEAHLREMQYLLDLGDNGVKMVSIYGPAGIGKTTIARALQSLISDRFQLTCFVENLRGSNHSGLDEYGLKLRLQENLLSSILNQDGMRICHLGAVKEWLCDLKVLIILDDVNDVKQLEALANETAWFGPGSRIIVTTENKELLQRHGINNMYHVWYPSSEEALKILCRYAFRQSYPHDGFEKLAIKVTNLCGNLPLGLRVVGSCLQGKREDEWKYVIRRLETNIDPNIDDVLRVGYESLDENEQTLFLHIAVFFNHKDVGLVKSMLGDDKMEIEFGLNTLVNRSLIYISSSVGIVMHKLLQQMGRQEPWKRRVLIDAQEICDVLENDSGTGAVSGISFDTSGINDVIVSNRALRRMRNLRFVSVYKTRNDGNERLHIPKEMEFPPSLRFLHWEAYPSKSLPLRLCLQNLVELDMQESHLEKLWEGTQALTNLKEMNLSRSAQLKELPDLSKATELEILNLKLCEALVELPSSIGNLQKLEELDLEDCKNLKVIPTHMNLASLEWCSMGGCSQLTTFPDFFTNIKTLSLTGTAMEEVPASIKHWSHLTGIRIRSNRNLKTLTHIPENLDYLDLSHTNIEKIPDSIQGLEILDLTCCRKLTSLPELPGSLILLKAQDCESLERLTSPLNTPNAGLYFTNCFKLSGEARRLIIQQSPLNGFTFLPGRVMPSEFTHVVKGNSLTVTLSSSASSSSKFKACIMTEKLHRHVTLRCCIVSGHNKSISLEHCVETTTTRTEHLCIFHGDMHEVSSEVLFEFFIEGDNPSYKIIECGVRIMTDEPEISSSDGSSEYYGDSSYDFELNEVLEDFEDGVISCDSESENVERTKEHITDCWSWFFICFDLSDIMRNIGSLCWGRKQTESIAKGR